MAGPTVFDDTSTDHEQFEVEQLVQDRDASRSTADLTDGTARHLVNDPETCYFVVMVVDGGDARIHVFDQDGELDSSPQTWTGGSRTQSDAEPMTIGVGQGYDMAGRADDVWGYSRAPSEDESCHRRALARAPGGAREGASESTRGGVGCEDSHGWRVVVSEEGAE